MNNYEQERKRIVRMTRFIVTAVVLGIITTISAFVFLERIDNGYVGVRFSPNGGVREEALQTGVRWVGIDKVTQYPIRLQTVQAKKVALSTSDGKKIEVNIKYDYAVEPKEATKMYREFGNVTSDDIENGWLKARLQQNAREVYSKYPLLDILSGKSSTIEIEIKDKFAKAIAKRGFLVDGVVVGVPDVDKETQKSIDQIIQASQANEKAKKDAETAVTKAEAAAKVTRTNAQAKADAALMEAEAEAEANKKIANSVTKELIEYTEAQAREKKGWVTHIYGQSPVVTEDK